MAGTGETCIYHRDTIAVTSCESCHHPICRDCLFTDQLLPRFYFSFWSTPQYRFLCPSCYLNWHKKNATLAHKSRRKRTSVWLLAMLVGFGFPLLVMIFTSQLIYSLPQGAAILFLDLGPLVLFFSFVFILPYFLLYAVLLRKLSGYPEKARGIISKSKLAEENVRPNE